MTKENLSSIPQKAFCHHFFMKELVPVVNRKDRVLKYLSPKIIHKKELCHREVAIYLLSKSGKIFVQKRKGGYFDHSVAGHVRKNETYRQAALREIKEEVGLDLKPSDLKSLGKFHANTFSHKGYNNDRFFTLFVNKFPIDSKLLKINKRELEAMIPMSRLQIKEVLKGGFRLCAGGFLVSFPLFLRRFLDCSKKFEIKKQG